MPAVSRLSLKSWGRQAAPRAAQAANHSREFGEEADRNDGECNECAFRAACSRHSQGEQNHPWQRRLQQGLTSGGDAEG
jgi:hypothetical protein